jgi:hypothetical protein
MEAAFSPDTSLSTYKTKFCQSQETTKCRWEEYNKLEINELGCEINELDPWICGSPKVFTAGPFEHCNGISGFIEGGDFLIWDLKLIL